VNRPDLDWLIERLARLNPSAAIDRPDIVRHHADQIYGHWLALRFRGDSTAIEIRGRQRPHAKRITVERGTTNEMKRLQRVAHGTSDKRWVTAWLGVSGATQRLIGWKPSKRRGGFEIELRGHYAVMPTRADAVPLIERALRRLAKTKVEKRRKRKPDRLAVDFVGAVRVAHRVMVHDSADRRGNGLARFGDDISSRFESDFIF
jgi:hypothetical protein